MKQKCHYTKNEILEAICWMFGFTKKEALKYYKNASESSCQIIAEGYFENCRKNFWED